MKNIFKVIFISFIVLLTGCEAEKEFAKQDKIIVRPFSMKSMTAKTNSKLSQAVSNIRKIKTNTTTDSNSSKLVFDEKAGLYFDDEKGLYIEKDNLKSYTFPVIRTSADEKIKNICFNEKPNGNYDVFLVKYDLTKEEVLNLTEEEKALREKQFVALMKDGVNVDSFKFQCINITLTTTTEYAVPLDNGELTGNFGYTTVSHITTVLIGSSCYFDNGSSGGGFNQGVGSNGSYNGNGATGSGSSSNTQLGSDIITGLNTQDFGNSLTDGELFYYNYTSFMSGLNEDQKAIFENQPGLINYLVRNNWSDNSRDFILQTIFTYENPNQSSLDFIQNVLNNPENIGEVDFSKKIVYDSSFSSTKTDCINKKIQSNTNNFYYKMLSTFSNSTNHNLTFKIGTTPVTDWGITRGDNGTINNYEIVISPNVENGSNLMKMVTLCHELIHSYMYNTLESLGLITFDSSGKPYLNISCSTGVNYNNVEINSLLLEDRFEALICAMNQNGTITTNWTHQLFNSTNFSVVDYRQEIENLIYTEHDWNNEEPDFKNQAITIFGSNWKHEIAKAVSWIGLEKTAEYNTYKDSYLVDFAKYQYISDIKYKITTAKKICQ